MWIEEYVVDGHSRSIVDEFSWILPVLVGASALALLIFLEPSWGANAAASLSLLVAVVAIIIQVLAEKGYFKAINIPGTFGRWQRRTVSASLAVIMAAGLVVWLMEREGSPADYLKGRVRIGFVDQNYPGWHERQKDLPDVHNGFDVLLVEALRKRFYKADFVWVPLAALPDRENRLSGDKDERDDVDLVISNFSMTLERREKIDFAGPYFLDVQGLLTRTGNRTPNAKETTLCGLGSSTGEKTIKGLSWRLHQEPTLEKCIGMYERGEVAGVSTDMAILQPYVKDRAASEKPLPGTVVDLQALGTEEYGIGIPNNHPKLCAALNKAVEDFLRTSWEAAFRAFLTPAGVSPANRKPPGVEECEPAGPAFVKDDY